MVAKEFELAGLPTALVCAAPEMALSLGVPRTVRGGGVSHPVGDPALSPDAEAALQRRLVTEALEALTCFPRCGTCGKAAL